MSTTSPTPEPDLPNLEGSVKAPGPDPAKLPPFVQIVKTPEDCQVNHNLIDPWLAIALLEMGKEKLMDTTKPKLVTPAQGGFGNGFLKKMHQR